MLGHVGPKMCKVTPRKDTPRGHIFFNHLGAEDCFQNRVCPGATGDFFRIETAMSSLERIWRTCYSELCLLLNACVSKPILKERSLIQNLGESEIQ